MKKESKKPETVVELDDEALARVTGGVNEYPETEQGEEKKQPAMRQVGSAALNMINQTANIDLITDNIANVNTYGGTKARAEFQDLYYQTLRDANADTSNAIQIVEELRDIAQEQLDKAKAENDEYVAKEGGVPASGTVDVVREMVEAIQETGDKKEFPTLPSTKGTDENQSSESKNGVIPIIFG